MLILGATVSVGASALEFLPVTLGANRGFSQTQKMGIQKIRFFYLLIVFGLCSCGLSNENNEVEFLSCKAKVDTTSISNDANRGGWLLNEKLFLSAGLEPLDKRLCDSIELRSQTVWTPSGKERPCHLYDLFPPFRVFKNAHSDTLFVEYDNRTILFEIPSHHCQ